MKMKHGVLTATVALLMGGAGVSQAAMLLDPDGQSNVNGGTNLAPIEIEQLDWNQGATLAQGGNQAIANFLNGSGPTDFWVYSHATLAVGNGPGGITLTPSNVDVQAGNATLVNGEYTAVLGFKEKVTSVTTGGGGLATAAFDLVPTPDAFFAVFFDPASNANDLTGDGYTDGTKILELGVQATAGGTFTVNTAANPVDLDQSNDGDDWNGKQTVTGSGSQQDITLELSAANDPDVYINPDFILNDLVEAMFLNIDLTLPFNGKFNPSYAFNTSTGTAGTADHTVCSPAATPCTGTDTLGSINGGLTKDASGTWVASGSDFMFSTDANSVWRGVPEPGVLALMGMGLAAFGWSSNRRKPQAA